MQAPGGATVTIRVSPRVLLYESGQAPPPLPEGWIALPHAPSRAFGDGSHPTTRLCAGAVDLICRRDRPLGVLDVGTGTGILARIARARGAGFVAGTDIDPEALRAAETNGLLDAHPLNITWARENPGRWGPRFGLVVANILEGELRALAPELARALMPGGLLLLSGFTPLQIPAILAGFEGFGLSRVQESLMDEWAMLLLRNP